MVNQGIEFLQVERPETKQEVLATKLKAASIVVLIVYALFLGGVFSTWFYLQKQEERVLEQIELKKNQVKELQEVESLQVVLKQKLSALSPILAKESLDYSQLLEAINGLAGESVSLSGFEMTEDGQIDFSGQAANAVQLADFLDNLIAQEGLGFKKVILSSITRNIDGSYAFNIQFSELE